MNYLKLYLQSARIFNQPHVKSLIFGNTSADMDSVVSSIAMAWYYGSLSSTKSIFRYTPVINCPRHELPLRIEIIEHLKHFGMDEQFLRDNILFCDDDVMKDLSHVESVGLVDFNELNDDFKVLADRVHFIIDHHVDNNLYLDSLREKEIKLIGSACTIVTKKIMEVNKHENNEEFNTIDSDLALFLSAPLSLDSSNFKLELKGSKWLEEDNEVFQKLMSINLQLKNDPVFLYKNLNAYKSDVELNLNLGVRNLMIKDYKEYNYNSGGMNVRIGVSTMNVKLDIMYDHFTYDVLEQHFLEYQAERNLSLYMFASGSIDENGNFVKLVAMFHNTKHDKFYLSKYDELINSFEISEEFKFKNKKLLYANDYSTENNYKYLITYHMDPKMTRKNLEKHLKLFYTSI